jgi:uncharacterized membrane protein
MSTLPHTLDELTKRNVSIIAAMEKQGEDHRSRGERIADIVARTVGSWTFIIVQSTILVLWIALNLIGWWKHWDPYPFILLNLALSFQAAYASPIIMISQNRQAKVSERRNHLDLQINMLAEQETTEILRLLRLLCERSGILGEQAGCDPGFEEETCPDQIVRHIEEEIEVKLASPNGVSEARSGEVDQ